MFIVLRFQLREAALIHRNYYDFVVYESKRSIKLTCNAALPSR
jgi:hypothetical protein